MINIMFFLWNEFCLFDFSLANENKMTYFAPQRRRKVMTIQENVKLDRKEVKIIVDKIRDICG
jgi:hypothetical protein